MDTAKISPLPLDAAHAAQVREHLDIILGDSVFAGASRRSRLLRFLVEETLEDRGDSLKESVIAATVFKRVADYDPQVDSLVRVEIGRIRSRLAEYYDRTGPDQSVRIDLPKGSYRPVFLFREFPLEVPPPAPRSHWKFASVIAVLCAVGLIAAVIWRTRSGRTAAPEAVAVLPFLNLTGDPVNDYLSDGISDELTEALAEFNNLRVVARTSAFQYKGKNIDVREIGRNLHVDAVLEGSIAKRNGELHLVAQLIRTSDGFHLWSRAYDFPPTELPAFEAGIAREARNKLSGVEVAAFTKAATGSRNPEAHDLYIRAVYELNRRTGSSTREAIELARQAVAKDASFPQPYILLAAAESQLNTLNVQAPAEGAKRAMDDVARALELDPANSAAHAQRALLAYTGEWDWPQAEREFRQALASGSHGSAENLYGWCLMTRGRFREAEQHLQAASELDPLSLGPQLNQVENLIAAKRYDVAKTKANQILQNSPDNPVALALMLELAVAQKDCSAARAASGRLMEKYPRAAVVRIGVLSADHACQTRVDAQAALDAIANEKLGGYISPYTIAAAFAYQGDAEHVMSYLQKAAEVHEPRLMSLKVDSVFEGFSKDSRFVALERKLGLID